MLGYRSNVEMSKKQWPDNYIAKAKSLKILNNVSYAECNEDALRGEIANLVWDALNVEKRYTTTITFSKSNLFYVVKHTIFVLLDNIISRSVY